jgi:hypothetical protein
LCTVFSALRWLVRDSTHWRMMPHDFRHGGVAADAALAASGLLRGCGVVLVHKVAGRKKRSSVIILDSRTMQSTPESGARSGYDSAKRCKEPSYSGSQYTRRLPLPLRS